MQNQMNHLSLLFTSSILEVLAEQSGLAPLASPRSAEERQMEALCQQLATNLAAKATALMTSLDKLCPAAETKLRVGRAAAAVKAFDGAASAYRETTYAWQAVVDQLSEMQDAPPADVQDLLSRCGAGLVPDVQRRYTHSIQVSISRASRKVTVCWIASRAMSLAAEDIQHYEIDLRPKRGRPPGRRPRRDRTSKPVADVLKIDSRSRRERLFDHYSQCRGEGRLDPVVVEQLLKLQVPEQPADLEAELEWLLKLSVSRSESIGPGATRHSQSA